MEDKKPKKKGRVAGQKQYKFSAVKSLHFNSANAETPEDLKRVQEIRHEKEMAIMSTAEKEEKVKKRKWVARNKQNSYPMKTWAKAKSMYESGLYSLRAIHQITEIKYNTLKNRKDRDRWQSGRLYNQIEDEARQNIIEELRNRQVDPAKIADKIVGLLDAKKTVNLGDGITEKEDDHVAIDKGIDRYLGITGADGKRKEKVQQNINIEHVDMKSITLNANSQEALNAYQELIRGTDK